MAKGKIQYDSDGRPICELCGKAFDRLGLHVWMVHNIKAGDYKKMFGLDNKVGLISKRSKELIRGKTLANWDIVIKKNLLEKGKNSRFYKGNKGRTKEMMSEQSRLRLKKHINNIKNK